MYFVTKYMHAVHYQLHLFSSGPFLSFSGSFKWDVTEGGNKDSSNRKRIIFHASFDFQNMGFVFICSLSAAFST